MPELNILNTLLLIGFLIFVSDNTIARLIHILAPERYWTFSREMLAYIIIYLCAFPLVFSLPVSYTHLDVYKRQLSHSPRAPPASASALP